jgi:hypothetical protein
MRIMPVMVAVCGVPLLTAAVAEAHHSFAAEFDASKPIRLKGRITKVEFMNPHSWIHIAVKKKDGSVEEWAIEGGTPNTLFRKGVNRKTLALGTEVSVDGYLARDGSHRASGRNITLTDGRKLFLAGSGSRSIPAPSEPKPVK